MSDALCLDSFDLAVEYLRKILDGKIPDQDLPEDISITGELAEIKIEIEGANYHSSITGNLSRGLWEYQQEFYRAVARSLYGVSTIKSLSKEDQEKFNLVFQVEDGCSKIVANIKDIVGYLKEGVNSMDSRHRLILYLGAIIAVTSGATFAYVKSLDVSSDTQIALAKETTAQMQVVRDAAKEVPEVQRWVVASQQGARSLAKGASDATSLTIGQITADSDELRTINRRAPRTISDTEILEQEFRIIVTKDTDSTIRNIILNANGVELTAMIDESQFDESQLDRLWEAVRHRKPIYLSVAAKKTGDEYKNAVLIDIPEADDAI